MGNQISSGQTPISNAAIRLFALLAGIAVPVALQAQAKLPFVKELKDTPQPALITTGVAGTCFRQNNGPHAASLAKATVQLLALDADEKQGSGVIIADSADATGNNKILTAGHMVRDSRKAHMPVLVVASDNTLIGLAVVEAIPRRYPYGADGRDLAVIRMAAFHDAAAEKKFREIQGIELAPVQAKSGFLYGVLDDPTVPTNGASGGPIINSDGKLVGIDVWAFFRTATSPVRLNRIGAGDGLSPTKLGQFTLNGASIDTDVELPRTGRVFAVTVIDKAIRNALGPAGKDVRKGNSPVEDVTLMGYPLGYCAVVQGALAPVGKVDASVLNFDTRAGQPAHTGSFAKWNDPKATFSHVRTLLEQARDEHLPVEPEITERLTDLSKVKGLKEIELGNWHRLEARPSLTLENLTATMRTAADQTKDGKLADELRAGSEQLIMTAARANQFPAPIRWAARLIP